MPRIAYLLSLTTLACTSDATERFPLLPAHLPDGVIEPGDAPPPEPPAACLTVPFGHTSLGTSASEELRDVAITNTGSILAVGYDRGTFTPHGLFGARGLVLEITPDLAGVAEVGVLDSTGTDSLESIAIAPDAGTIWLVGRTNGELPDLPGSGGVDFVIGELTGAGLERRARGFDSTSELAQRLAIGPAGLLAIAGHAQASSADGGSSLDPFLAVYQTTDGSASPLWLTSRRHPTNELNRAVDVSAAQVIVGGDISDGDEQGMYVTAWDRDAGRLWRRQLSHHGRDSVTAVKLLPDGNVLWAGSSTSQLGSEVHGGLDAVVGILDGATGAPVWTMQYGGAADDHVTDVAVDDHGRIAIVGDTQAPSGLDVDAFLFVLDADGRPLREERWGSAGDDRPSAVAMDTCGGIALVGYTNGDLVDLARGGRDAFVLVTRVDG
jgi:hypothetical protein